MASPPSPPVEPAVEDLLRATGLLLRRLRQEANPARLSWSQTVAMARLEQNEAMTTAELARAEGVKPQSMGATLAALEQDGLIARRPHPTDGRQVLFALTEAGLRVRRSHQLLKRQWLSQAIAGLEPEERTALAAAAELIRRLADR